MEKSRLIELDDDGLKWRSRFRFIPVNAGDEGVLLYISYMLSVADKNSFLEKQFAKLLSYRR